MGRSGISRRKFAKLTGAAAVAAASHSFWLRRAIAGAASPASPLAEFGYGDVTISSEIHEAQLRETPDVLMNLSEDSLLKPFRQMAGQPAPGADWGAGTTTTKIMTGTGTMQASRPAQLSGNGYQLWRDITQSPARRTRVKKYCA